jgi:hypothetical protein
MPFFRFLLKDRHFAVGKSKDFVSFFGLEGKRPHFLFKDQSVVVCLFSFKTRPPDCQWPRPLSRQVFWDLNSASTHFVLFTKNEKVFFQRMKIKILFLCVPKWGDWGR